MSHQVKGQEKMLRGFREILTASLMFQREVFPHRYAVLPLVRSPLSPPSPPLLCFENIIWDGQMKPFNSHGEKHEQSSAVTPPTHPSLLVWSPFIL